MSFDDEWGRTVEASGEYARPDKLEGHLIMVFPLGYVEHMQTKFTVPGKKSDAICCDIVDLDDVNETGQPGKVYRSSNLMQAQLIMGLRPFIGSKTIIRIGKGPAKNGMNAPWAPIDAVGEPGAVERANAWMAAHPEFVKSTFSPRTQTAAPPAPTQQYGPGPQPGFQPQVQQYPPQQPQYPPQQPQYPPQQPQYAGQGYGQAPGAGYGQQPPMATPPAQYGQPPTYPQNAAPSYPGYGQPAPQQQLPQQYPPAARVPGPQNLSDQELSVLDQARAMAAERERQIQAQFGDQPPF